MRSNYDYLAENGMLGRELSEEVVKVAKPSVEQLREWFTYDPCSGELRWAIKARKQTLAGFIAGTASRDGYRRVRARGASMLVHRVAWCIKTGEWPKEVDHINGDRGDNRWVNLREVSHVQNCYNRERTRRNSSGFKGVSRHRGSGKWQASIKVMGKQKYLGLFDTAEEASAAYCVAAAEHFGEYRRVA